MNSLTETEYWKSVNTLMNVEGRLMSVLKRIDDYIIPPKAYKHLSEFRTYKYPMAKAVSMLFDKELIIPVLLADPPKKSAEPVVLPHIFCFPIVIGGKTKIAVDLSSSAKTIRNNTTDEVEVLDIDPRHFYGFIQSGATTYLMKEKEHSLIRGEFATKAVKTYARMVAKCIDKIQPFSHDEAGFALVTFVVAAYAYKVMLGYSAEDAFEAAKKSADGAKDIVISIASSLTPENNKIESFSDICSVLERNSRTVREGTITYRGINREFIRMYGTNSAWSMEHFPSFIQMLQMSLLWLGLYNDRMVQTQSAQYIKDLEKILGALE